MELERIAAAWAAVGATRSRSAKVAILADVLRTLPDDEVAIGASMLAGAFRQGRIGVGYRTVGAIEVSPATHAELTLAEVDEIVDELAAASGPGSVARRTALLEQLLGRATEIEQTYLRGVLLGELRQGALEGVILQAVAEAAEVDLTLVQRAAMLVGDVPAAAVTAMTTGAEGLRAHRLTRFRPVLPMLASSAPTVADALAITGHCVVDTKLDGMRLQIHVGEDRVALYTRSLREVRLPAVVAAVRAIGLPPGIYDGEALATGDDDRPLPFQEQMRDGAALRPHLFDVLQLGDRDLIDEPLAVRAPLLAEVGGDLVVARTTTDDPDLATGHYRDAVIAGYEGVVIKDLDSPWEAGRRGKGWVKVKPVHTLDLVVLAVEWGSGRRRGWLSNLHLGCRIGNAGPTAPRPSHEDGPAGDESAGDDMHAGGSLVMLGKTFKGMTDEMLAWQTERFLELETHREGGVVHVRPEQVVEVAIDGVQTSRRYAGGMALRFARVKRYREDKTVDQADTLDTVRGIHDGRVLPELPPPQGA